MEPAWFTKATSAVAQGQLSMIGRVPGETIASR
jgi:hypothetical protein